MLEICASNIQSAINAQNSGADRIELCTELPVGGLTPSFGLIKHAVEQLSIPIFVLIRPRGGDFVYSDEEFQIMKSDIEIAKKLGAKGIVSGVLNIDKTIDYEKTKELVELSGPLEFTFHKAFDEVPDPIKELENLIELGVNRILTSGQKETAEKGLDLLLKLKEIAGNRLTILPGGSVRPNNAELILKKGFKEIHSSAVKKGDNSYISDSDTIKKLVNLKKQ